MCMTIGAALQGQCAFNPNQACTSSKSFGPCHHKHGSSLVHVLGAGADAALPDWQKPPIARQRPSMLIARLISFMHQAQMAAAPSVEPSKYFETPVKNVVVSWVRSPILQIDEQCVLRAAQIGLSLVCVRPSADLLGILYCLHKKGAGP